MNRCHDSITWEEAEDKQRRGIEKIRSELLRTDGIAQEKVRVDL